MRAESAVPTTRPIVRVTSVGLLARASAPVGDPVGAATAVPRATMVQTDHGAKAAPGAIETKTDTEVTGRRGAAAPLAQAAAPGAGHRHAATTRAVTAATTAIPRAMNARVPGVTRGELPSAEIVGPVSALVLQTRVGATPGGQEPIADADPEKVRLAPVQEKPAGTTPVTGEPAVVTGSNVEPQANGAGRIGAREGRMLAAGTGLKTPAAAGESATRVAIRTAAQGLMSRVKSACHGQGWRPAKMSRQPRRTSTSRCCRWRRALS